MSGPCLLVEAQTRRIDAYFPSPHRIPRVDDRRIESGNTFPIRNRLRRRDTPPVDCPHKTICNRFICWSSPGMFNLIFAELAAEGGIAATVIFWLLQ